jgi:hypothetical protein
MACESIKLADIELGDSWEGLGHTCSSGGNAFANPLTGVTMTWTDKDGVVGLTLTEADGITIRDAAAWSFAVDAMDAFPLAVGFWSWAIKCTDSTGYGKTRLRGTKRVTDTQ